MTPEHDVLTLEEVRKKILEDWPEKLNDGAEFEYVEAVGYYCAIGHCSQVLKDLGIQLDDRSDIIIKNDSYKELGPTKVRSNGMRKYFERYVTLRYSADIKRRAIVFDQAKGWVDV